MRPRATLVLLHGSTMLTERRVARGVTCRYVEDFTPTQIKPFA